MKLLENLNWRYATKKFDSNLKVSQSDLEKLKEAVRLSVSSYGLQLYKVLIIQNSEIKTRLRKHSWDQSQITDASHLFVFCNYTANYNEHVDEFVGLVTESSSQSNTKGLLEYGKSIKASIDRMPDAQRQSWSEKQTYLALNNLLLACAELRIDACPMEGFDNQAYNEILGLNDKGLNAAVIAPVGYRSASDKTQHRMKVRKPSDKLFKLI